MMMILTTVNTTRGQYSTRLEEEKQQKTNKLKSSVELC